MRSTLCTLCLAMWGMATVPACTDESTFTDEELDMLAAHRLPKMPPADPSNGYADDTPAAQLGKKFFFDTRFSGPLNPPNDGVSNGSLGAAGTSGRVACYSCHKTEAGGTDHRSLPAATSLGTGYTPRNAPTVIDAAYSDVADGGWQLWDGRKDSLWSQALGPPENPVEHNGTRLGFAHVIYDHYRTAYEAVFGSLPDLADTARFPSAGIPGDAAYDDMTTADRDAVDRIYANFGKAIEAYERRLVSSAFEPSAFDRMLAGDPTAMTASAVRGAKLFVGKAGCDGCHRGAAFTDFVFHNIGCPQEGEHVPQTDVGRSAGISQVKADRYNRAGAYSDRVDDSHLTSLAAVPGDVGAFKTPTLRNLPKTAPYMHDGIYASLGDVMSHFSGSASAFASSPEVANAPRLLDSELADLEEFLRSLDDGPQLATPDFPEGLTEDPPLPD